MADRKSVYETVVVVRTNKTINWSDEKLVSLDNYKADNGTMICKDNWMRFEFVTTPYISIHLHTWRRHERPPHNPPPFLA